MVRTEVTDRLLGGWPGWFRDVPSEMRRVAQAAVLSQVQGPSL